MPAQDVHDRKRPERRTRAIDEDEQPLSAASMSTPVRANTGATHHQHRPGGSNLFVRLQWVAILVIVTGCFSLLYRVNELSDNLARKPFTDSNAVKLIRAGGRRPAVPVPTQVPLSDEAGVPETEAAAVPVVTPVEPKQTAPESSVSKAAPKSKAPKKGKSAKPKGKDKDKKPPQAKPLTTPAVAPGIAIEIPEEGKEAETLAPEDADYERYLADLAAHEESEPLPMPTDPITTRAVTKPTTKPPTEATTEPPAPEVSAEPLGVVMAEVPSVAPVEALHAEAAAEPDADSAPSNPDHARRPKPQQYLDPVARAQHERCFDERDYGLIDKIKESVTSYCAAVPDTTDERQWTKVNTYNARGGIKATVFENLVLDLQGARIFKPIQNMSQDGHLHDPRFVFSNKVVRCGCFEMRTRRGPGKALMLWDPTLASHPVKADPPSTLCETRFSDVPPATDNDVEFKGKVILAARRDDHNPFFQLSVTLNAWIMMQALGWEANDVQLVYLDASFPSPIDALHKRMLSPAQEVVRGETLLNKRVFFNGPTMLAPFELSGPMMQHLDDKEPCFDSELLKDFRQHALDIMEAKNVANPTTTSPDTQHGTAMVVTIITRKNYSGRTIQRRWLNEDEVVERMKQDYAGMDIVIQSIDFVDLPLEQQMAIMLHSDVVIGMHGAGMVNVLWTKPKTLIVEIFPKKRKRWGYRNLCQFLGCQWREFRGGSDTGEGDNRSDKFIPFDTWRAFFDPLLQKAYKARAVANEQQPDVAIGPEDLGQAAM